MSDQEIENEIQAKGLNAPRITPDHIESVISSKSLLLAGLAHLRRETGNN